MKSYQKYFDTFPRSLFCNISDEEEYFTQVVNIFWLPEDPHLYCTVPRKFIFEVCISSHTMLSKPLHTANQLTGTKKIPE